VPVFRQGSNSTPADASEQDVTAALNAGVDGSGAQGRDRRPTSRSWSGSSRVPGMARKRGNPALTVLATIETPLGLVNAPWLAKARNRG